WGDSIRRDGVEPIARAAPAAFMSSSHRLAAYNHPIGALNHSCFQRSATRADPMTTSSKSTLLAACAATFAAAALLATAPQASAQQTVLIGNATANDTQAAINDKFAELITSYTGGKIKASARHGQSLGNNTQMIAAMQAGSIAGMVMPAG